MRVDNKFQQITYNYNTFHTSPKMVEATLQDSSPLQVQSVITGADKFDQNQQKKSSDMASSEDSSSLSERDSSMLAKSGKVAQPCYGRELWDCLQVLEDNTAEKSKQLSNMKEFFQAVRIGLENFSLHVKSTIQQFNRVKNSVKASQDKKRKSIVYSQKGAVGNIDIIDTLSTSVEKFVEKVDTFANQYQAKADLLFQDLIEPLDMYQKHYKSTNKSVLEQTNQIWMSLHQQRTQMLFTKENYYNQMFQLN